MSTTALVIPGKVSPTSLHLDESLSYEDWEAVGIQLQRAGHAMLWWLGDWLRHGEKRYGETYTQAIEHTGYAKQTLMDAAWVAGKIHPSLRRESLSWHHHKVIAALEPKEQAVFLDKAEADDLSVAGLRAAVKGEPTKKATTLVCPACGFRGEMAQD